MFIAVLLAWIAWMIFKWFFIVSIAAKCSTPTSHIQARWEGTSVETVRAERREWAARRVVYVRTMRRVALRLFLSLLVRTAVGPRFPGAPLFVTCCDG